MRAIHMGIERCCGLLTCFPRIPALIVARCADLTFVCRVAPCLQPIDRKQAAVIEVEKRKHAALGRLFTTGFTVNLVLALLASYALINLFGALSSQATVNEYDPFNVSAAGCVRGDVARGCSRGWAVCGSLFGQVMV